MVEQLDATQLDDSAVAAARSGDRRALDALVESYLPLVYSIVGHALSATADVDDVVQDTMVRVVRGISGLREPSRFRSWLVAITMNQIREHHRQAVPAVDGLADYEDRPDPNAEFVDQTIARLGVSQQRREVVMAAEWLLAEDRELLSLWALERAGELTRAELVNALEITPHHVTVRLGRMKERLAVARLVVRALAADPTCPELDRVAGDWPGEPNPLWRKRLGRHVGECARCRQVEADMVPAERLLAAAALLPMPADYAPRLVATVHDLTGTAHDLTQTAQLGHDSAPRSPRARPKGRGWAHVATKPLLVVAGVAAISATGLVIALPRLLPSDTTANQIAAAPLVPPTSAIASGPTGLPSASASPDLSAPASTSASAAPTSVPAAANSAAPPAPATATSTPPAVLTPAEQVLALINKARSAAGLPAYTMDADLVASATTHNQTMAGGCGLSHQCPGEAAIGDRETAAGVHWTSCGENIGDGGPVADTNSAIAAMAVGLTQDMLNETPPNDGHRLNILSSSYTRIGIAVLRDSAGTVWLTQDFANSP